MIKADQLPQKITLNMDYYLGKVKRTITQGAVPSPSSSCPTIHPTVLMLNLFPPSVPQGAVVSLSGTLTDNCTTAGVNGATIIFTFTGSFFYDLQKGIMD